MSRWIDADALIEKYYKQMDELMESTSEHLSAEALSLLCGFTLINSAPSIDIEPKRGKWLEWVDCEGEVFWKCSACGQVSEASAAGILYKFCPFCGVRMKGADDE